MIKLIDETRNNLKTIRDKACYKGENETLCYKCPFGIDVEYDGWTCSLEDALNDLAIYRSQLKNQNKEKK